MTKRCLQCEGDFSVKPSHASQSYCSRSCMGAAYATRMLGPQNPNYSAAGRRDCEVCGVEFISYTCSQRTCGRKCGRQTPQARLGQLASGNAPTNIARLRAMAVAKRKPKALPKPRRRKSQTPCAVCGDLYDCPPSIKRRTCSAACSKVLTRGNLRLCVVCGTEFRVPPSQCNRTCSRRCLRLNRSAMQRGEKGPRWAGGRTAATVLARNRIDYKTWRATVFARDDFTCADCGMRGGKLTAHHIRPFSTHPEFRLDVRNGISLCWPCHQRIKGAEGQHAARYDALVIVRSNGQAAA
jgi:hypothetical protein